MSAVPPARRGGKATSRQIGRMMDPGTAKALVQEFSAKVLAAEPGTQLAAARRFCAPDVTWRGCHPFNLLQGPQALVRAFHAPLNASFPDLVRKEDILFAGAFGSDSWVTAAGHYEGTFNDDWLGIPATGRHAEIRFGEFLRVGQQGVEEACVVLDLVGLLRQAGIDVLPPDLGAIDPVPGPSARDGVILESQPEVESARTLSLVGDMVAGLLSFDGRSLESMGMERFWHPDMLWYGPAGIGTTRGLAEFQARHQRPFLTAFPDRTGGRYTSCIAEGRFAGICGWPSVRATHAGGYLGVPATGRKVAMRVLDWWARDGDLLSENWVLIDMIDLFLQLGVDLFDRLHPVSCSDRDAPMGRRVATGGPST
jgi:predicted ester cyclase